MLRWAENRSVGSAKQLDWHVRNCLECHLPTHRDGASKALNKNTYFIILGKSVRDLISRHGVCFYTLLTCERTVGLSLFFNAHLYEQQHRCNVGRSLAGRWKTGLWSRCMFTTYRRMVSAMVFEYWAYISFVCVVICICYWFAYAIINFNPSRPECLILNKCATDITCGLNWCSANYGWPSVVGRILSSILRSCTFSISHCQNPPLSQERLFRNTR